MRCKPYHSSNSTPVEEKRLKISLNDFGMKDKQQETFKLQWRNKEYESSSTSNKKKPNLIFPLEDIRKFKLEITQLTQDQIGRIDRDYMNELRSLAEAINKMFA